MKKELIRTERYIHIFDEAGKQLAHLPLNDAPILKGVPLLPPLEQEDDVEKLAEEEYPIIPNTSPNVNWDRANKQEGFERGYNKAREKYKFTEDDLWVVFNYGRSNMHEETFESLLKRVSQPKTPTHFEFEMDCTLVGLDIESECTLRTTTNSQGQQVACGKYIY